MKNSILTLLLCLPLIVTLIDENERYEESKWPSAQERVTIPDSIYRLAINDT